MAERAINSDMTVVSAAAAMANSNVGNPPSSLPVPSTTLSKAYGSVEISLENCLLPKERLSAATPSSCDGLDEQTEMDLRILGCELIQTAGILLRLPQVLLIIRLLNLGCVMSSCSHLSMTPTIGSCTS